MKSELPISVRREVRKVAKAFHVTPIAISDDDHLAPVWRRDGTSRVVVGLLWLADRYDDLGGWQQNVDLKKTLKNL